MFSLQAWAPVKETALDLHPQGHGQVTLREGPAGRHAHSNPGWGGSVARRLFPLETAQGSTTQQPPPPHTGVLTGSMSMVPGGPGSPSAPGRPGRPGGPCGQRGRESQVRRRGTQPAGSGGGASEPQPSQKHTGQAQGSTRPRGLECSRTPARERAASLWDHDKERLLRGRGEGGGPGGSRGTQTEGKVGDAIQGQRRHPRT